MRAFRDLDHTVAGWKEPPQESWDDPWTGEPDPDLSLRLTFLAIFLIWGVCLILALTIPTGWV